jgi:hypothetical protein
MKQKILLFLLEQLKPYLLALWGAFIGKKISSINKDLEVPVQNQEVQVVHLTYITPEYIEKVRRDFPNRNWKAGMELADMAMIAGEQRVIEYMQRDLGKGRVV